MVRGLSPKSSGRTVHMIVLVYSIFFTVHLYGFVYSHALRDIHCTSMAQYSLFVLNVPLNNNNPNQTSYLTQYLYVHIFLM